MIEVYTDGSCNNNVKKGKNPKEGGIGIVVIDGDEIIRVSEGRWLNTTSAAMEIMAVTRALELINPGEEVIRIHSDNQYVVKAITEGWLDHWIETNQIHRKNWGLWQRFKKIFDIHQKQGGVEFIWVRGHDGHTYNEIADELANEGRKHKEIVNEVSCSRNEV